MFPKSHPLYRISEINFPYLYEHYSTQQQQQQKQLVAHGQYCQLQDKNSPLIFIFIIGNSRSISKFLCIYSTISLGICGTLMEKLWAGTYV